MWTEQGCIALVWGKDQLQGTLLSEFEIVFREEGLWNLLRLQ